MGRAMEEKVFVGCVYSGAVYVYEECL